MTTAPPPPVNVNEGSPTKKRKENNDGPPQDVNANGNGGYPYPQHYYPGGGSGGGPPPGHYYSHRQLPPGHYQGNYGSNAPIPYCQFTEGSSGYPSSGPGGWRGESVPAGSGAAPNYGRPGRQPHMYNGTSVNSAGVGYINGNGTSSKSSRPTSKNNIRTPRSMSDQQSGQSSVSSTSRREKDVDNKDKGRGSYRCGKCGVPKKGHVCPYQPKLKRRADEPPPEMRNAATQVEMDEFLVVRRLNLEIQGFPESYTAEPMGDVGVEVHPHSVPVPQPIAPQHPSSNGVNMSSVSIGQGHQTHRIMGGPNTVNGSNSSRSVGAGGPGTLLPPRPALSSSPAPVGMTTVNASGLGDTSICSVKKDDNALDGQGDMNENVPSN